MRDVAGLHVRQRDSKFWTCSICTWGHAQPTYKPCQLPSIGRDHVRSLSHSYWRIKSHSEYWDFIGSTPLVRFNRNGIWQIPSLGFYKKLRMESSGGDWNEGASTSFPGSRLSLTWRKTHLFRSHLCCELTQVDTKSSESTSLNKFRWQRLSSNGFITAERNKEECVYASCKAPTCKSLGRTPGSTRMPTANQEVESTTLLRLHCLCLHA